MNILLIPDCQVKPGVPLDHLYSLSKFIVHRQPDAIVNIGDFFDLPSLSSYDLGKKAMEGRRVHEDIEAGNKAMRVMLNGLRTLQRRQRENKKRVYTPEMHFCIGNHEERIKRHVESNPQLDGLLSYDNLDLRGWEVHDFRDVFTVAGICFSHYFYNPLSGMPIGGSMDNRLNKLQASFVQGHEQSFLYGCRQTLTGLHMGLVAGAFYMHDENYKGPQANNHWRGICMLNNAENGVYDLETISLENLLKAY